LPRYDPCIPTKLHLNYWSRRCRPCSSIFELKLFLRSDRYTGPDRGSLPLLAQSRHRPGAIGCLLTSPKPTLPSDRL
jgi:hypothetical protein